MACLPAIHHPMWHTLPIRMSITPLPYLLRANNLNLIMHMSLYPWGRHMKHPEAII